MAGRRQHFIPRFLQAGFASHVNGDQVFTWVFRKDRPAFNTNLVNVGAEGDFYTEGYDTDVDAAITSAEGPFSDLVRRLRAGEPGSVSDPELSRLFVHLEFRTRHIRESFILMGNNMTSRILEYMRDDHTFLGYAERALMRDPSLLEKDIARHLIKHGLPLAFAKPLQAAIAPHIRPFLRQILPQFAAALRPQLTQMVHNATKSGHLRALRSDVAPPRKAHRYERLVYSVIDVQDSCLVLGDSAVLFGVAGSRRYKTFLEGRDKLCAVFLPIAPTRAVVAAPTQERELPTDLYRALARCSLEYFISSNHSERNESLRQEIGEDAALLSTDEIEDILTRLMQE